MAAVTLHRGPLSGAPVLAVPVRPARDRAAGKAEAGPGVEVLRELGVDAPALLLTERAGGEPGEIVSIPLAQYDVDTVHLLGIGDGSPTALRRAGATLARRCREGSSVATTAVHDASSAGIAAFVEGLLLACYGFDRRSNPKPARINAVRLVVRAPDRRRDAVARGIAVSEAVCLARDLANTPSLEKTPAWLAARAVQVAQGAGLGVRIWDDEQLAADGFGGVLAVGSGSAHPPRFIELSYAPAGARRHVVLVGKGITFDSGGLSLKPSDGMVAMKTDMAGGAAVIATLSALARLGSRVRVTGLVAAAENMPSGSAMRVQDVIRHYGGRTVEVLNTDAEGRLVLADALAYADAQLAPDAVVDLATLTGAATLGLGRRHGALYATADRLAGELIAAGARGGELLWQMPFVEEYRDSLTSDVADLRNVGDPAFRYSGGSITAALFLREFVGRRPWAHLDIAGPARADADEHELSKGATGFGVRTLLSWLAPA